MAAEIFFYGILIYIVYKIVFDFIVPVSQAGKQMKQQFRDVHSAMRDQSVTFQQQQNPQQQAAPKQSKNSASEYIDFEEIK
jgi:uncharacterized protein YybS (DUF2232 family)